MNTTIETQIDVYMYIIVWVHMRKGYKVIGLSFVVVVNKKIASSRHNIIGVLASAQC